jgi:hypothetical protein
MLLPQQQLAKMNRTMHHFFSNGVIPYLVQVLNEVQINNNSFWEIND